MGASSADTAQHCEGGMQGNFSFAYQPQLAFYQAA
jgi:hypothetical protein